MQRVYREDREKCPWILEMREVPDELKKQVSKGRPSNRGTKRSRCDVCIDESRAEEESKAKMMAMLAKDVAKLHARQQPKLCTGHN